MALLTAFAVVDSLALARWTRPRGRAELGMATALFFAALVGGPVLLLGYANVLWRWTLGPSSVAILSVTFAALARGRGARRVLEDCRGALLDLARLPIDAVVEAWRARSLVMPGLLVCAAFVGLALVLTYLIEFCRWDDAIYHTPIIGWAIQHHGFAIVDAPLPGVGGTNGYPKLCEGLCLWFVMFTDKTLIELPATLFAPPVMLAVYALSRRFVDRVDAMGLAVVLLLVPHSWRQFCSTYVDMEMAFFLLAATHYASRMERGARDLVVATVAFALAASTKTTWLIFVPPVAGVAYVLRLRDRADPAHSLRSDLVGLAASAAAVIAAGGLCLGRNWSHYGNPVWPVAYDIPRLGIHWPGVFTPADYRGHDPAVAEGFEVPRGGMHDVMRHGYGLAVMWVGGPLALVAIAVWAARVGREVVSRRPFDEGVRALAPIVLPCLVWIATGPNFGQPRYNLHVIAALLVLGAWLVRDAAAARLREGTLGAMLVMSYVPLFWMNDANPTTIDEEVERLTHPLATRTFSEHPSFDLLERQKQEELGADDEVVFSEGVAFPGLLWNFEFSNRVDYVAFIDGRDFEARLAELEPKWVCVGAATAARRALEQSGRWTLVGRTNPGLNEVAFRRKDTASPG